MSHTQTDVIDIRRGTADHVLVFALKMPGAQVAFLRDEPAALAQILGLEGQVDPAQAELIAIDDLEDLGLLGYLHEGLGITEAHLSAHGMALDALTGYVLLLRTRAFLGMDHDVRLTPAEPLTLVARLGEVATDWQSSGEIDTDSARPRPRPAMSPRDARNRARRIGAALFGAVMGLICLTLYLVLR